MRNTARGQPSSSTRHPKEQIPSSVPTVVGFPISMNQFSILQESEFAEFQSQVQAEDGLIDPRNTRLLRLQAEKRAEEQRILLSEGILKTIPLCRDEQGIVSIGEFEELVSSRNQPTFFHHSLFASPTDILSSQSVVNLNFELETGDLHDAMYNSGVKEVTYTNLICNKRISNAG